MFISVNSNERAEKIKKIVNKLLGNSAKYKSSLIEDLAPALAEMGAGQQAMDNQDDLMKLPEVQEKLKAMMQAHWDNWIDEKIPALGGQTPREASKSEDGKELLDGLISDFERNVISRP